MAANRPVPLVGVGVEIMTAARCCLCGGRCSVIFSNIGETSSGKKTKCGALACPWLCLVWWRLLLNMVANRTAMTEVTVINDKKFGPTRHGLLIS